jgi:hypothetical protein
LAFKTVDRIVRELWATTQVRMCVVWVEEVWVPTSKT